MIALWWLYCLGGRKAQQVKKCNKKPGELTTPRPFVFRSDERLQRKRHDTTGGEDGEPKPQEMKSPWVPLAKKISSFLNKTPARFRVRKQGEVFHNATEKEHRQRLSVPKPFEFRTDQRIKGSKFKPHEVEEEEEMRNMPKFHAKPVDKRVSGFMFPGSGHLGGGFLRGSCVLETCPDASLLWCRYWSPQGTWGFLVSPRRS
mgnify:CR=1 FL=1